MTATTEADAGAVTGSAETRREPKGDISRVHQEIARGLAEIVTEAGHQGVMCVYDWKRATEYGQDRLGECEQMLDSADRCLRVALGFLHQLRNELRDRVEENTATEVPF